MTIQEQLGLRIQQLRKKRELSQEKFSLLIGMDGIPDFSHCAEAEVRIHSMTQYRRTEDAQLAGKDLIGNFEQADEALARIWTRTRHNGQTWTADAVKAYRTEHKLSWHEMSNMESMQLVPREIHSKCLHYGGVAECKAMTGQEGGTVFD